MRAQLFHRLLGKLGAGAFALVACAWLAFVAPALAAPTVTMVLGSPFWDGSPVSVTGVAFSPSGRLLATANFAGNGMSTSVQS